MASSSIVIKVKYGETLRRFSASIEDKKIALDIVTLREKIRRLFGFGSNIDFTLTYVDEDGDEVTLVADYDLHDAVRQSLNPLRITVKLNNGSPGGTNVLLDPLESHLPHSQFQNLNSGATSSTPGVANPAEKMQAASLNQISGSSPMVTEFLKQTAVYLNQISASVASQKVHTPTSGSSDVNSEPSTVDDSKIPVNPEAGCSNSKVIEGLKLKDVQPLKSVDLNVPYYEYESPQGPINSTNSVVEGSTGENTNTSADGVEKKGTNDSGSSSGWSNGMLSAANLSSIVGVQTPNPSGCDGHHHPSCSPQRDVSCDCCGVYPITGYQCKSRVKENYEVCSTCFRGTGTDYIGMDCHQTPNPVPPPTLLESLKTPESKLDRAFLLDVNVPDGTIMAPFTRFTKVWRMCNNGPVIWPQGLQLHWVGGDRLLTSLSVDVKIPVDGLPMDKGLDIAVDFMAPGIPGQYTSYWSMASPSGQKFGQQVWVNIEIDANSRKDLGLTSLNLNLPPSPIMKNPEVVNHNHLMDCGNNLIKVTDPEAASADSDPNDQETGFPNDSVINDNDDVSSTMATRSPAEVAAMSSFSDSTEAETASTSLPVGPMVSSGLYPSVGLRPKSISSPTKDSSLLSSALVRGLPPPPTRVPVVQPLDSTSKKVRVRRDDKEQELLKYLEKMGFKKLDLNRKILRMNSYDLEKSIDDLCCALEWEPMLENLQEMGFVDEETNRRLLEKNYGSITCTVMDLINEETA